MDEARLEIPADITPKAFYEELLPKVFADNRAKAAQLAGSVNAAQLAGSVRAEVSGDGGGTWTIEFAAGEMKVHQGSVGTPLVTFSQTREDWQVTITQGVGKMLTKLGSAPAPSSTGKGLTPAKLERLKMMKGLIKFELTGYEGSRTLRLTIAVGAAQDGKDPVCNVSMTAADFQDISAGKLALQQAVMGGKVKLTGPGVPFAMQLGATLMM